MKYADGPTVTCEVHIRADRARVWALVTDIHVPARLSPELQRVEWIDGAAGPAVGAAFAGYNRHPLLGEWRTVSRVVELHEPRVFGWVVLDQDGRFAGSGPAPAEPMATWRFELEPDVSGTRLRQSVRVGPGRSGVSLAIDRMPDREEEVVAHRLGELRANIDASLRGMKDLAEADGRPAPGNA
ncbi:SRPBCC family protein [Streptomyces sp. NPDC052309]|uniref:SRPBCC family protein n=1 Tax=Streptomyces sp. NPDC052309 TaxID=3155421 RepID=UPI003442D876